MNFVICAMNSNLASITPSLFGVSEAFTKNRCFEPCPTKLTSTISSAQHETTISNPFHIVPPGLFVVRFSIIARKNHHYTSFFV